MILVNQGPTLSYFKDLSVLIIKNLVKKIVFNHEVNKNMAYYWREEVVERLVTNPDSLLNLAVECTYKQDI